MHPQEHLFRPYETILTNIVSNYPSPQTIHCSGRSPSTVRQNIRQALRLFIKSPSLSSVIPIDQARLVDREYIFSNNPDGTVYIGPRRGRVPTSPTIIGSETQPQSSIPSIDCSDPTTLQSVLHLKNFDHFPFPLNLYNLTPSPLLENYPNIELIPNPDGSFTIL